jgi:hypothetical protein
MTAACDPKTAFQSQQICLRTPTVPESIEYAKKNRVLYGSPGRGNILHLATEVFGQKAGIKMEHVLYTGVSEVMTGLPSGGVQVMFVTPPSWALSRMVASEPSLSPAQNRSHRFQMMKDVLPGYPPDRVVGQRPSAVVDKLNGAIRKPFRCQRSRMSCNATAICRMAAVQLKRQRSSTPRSSAWAAR